ncbi:MAG: polyphosphate kinase 1 [Ruminococcus sp.]|nr:polyphosphate kinase 1 [Ruminococcus sp.]
MRSEVRAAVCSRELSWLRFNTRVLEQAEDEHVPLMERFLFRNIWSSNLDEFCRTRIGKLLTLSLSDNGVRDVRTGMHPAEQLERISGHILTELPRADRVFMSLETELEGYGIRRLKSTEDISGSEAETLSEIFLREYKDRIEPVVITSDDDRFAVKNGSLYVACRLEAEGKRGIGLIDCSALPPVTELSGLGGYDIILTDTLAAAFADKLFPDFTVAETVSLRVMRSAFIDVESAYDENADTIALMSEFMDSREELLAVCTMLSKSVQPVFRYRLLERLSLDDSIILVTETPLSSSLIPLLYSRMSDRRELYYPEYKPADSFAEGGRTLSDAAAERDILLCYPYESIEPFLRMLEQAAADVSVTSVKMTLYRLADDSRIIKALCQAARAGKEVLVCVELRARFSERDNIAHARELLSAGCRVVYGIKGFKVHSKLCRIDMQQNGSLRRLTQIGTGNYNECSAHHYTDFSLVTCDASIADDADKVFEALESHQLPPQTGSLTTSPACLKTRILSLLDMEISAASAGENAYFGAKLNGLSDPDIIEKLTEASRAGVRIELAVRGICCIKPGVPGLTDNVSVISIVDRFLEHGRIYIFGSGTRRIVYISSADLMTRNLDRRVEAAVRINDRGIADKLCAYFEAQMSDTSALRRMRADGSYTFASGVGTSSQQQFMQRFVEKQEEITPRPEANDPLPEPSVPEPAADAPTDSDSAEAAEPPAVPAAADIPLPRKKSIFRRIIDFFRRKK